MKSEEDSNKRYPVGTKLEWPGESMGVVVENFKMPGDVCVKWDVLNEACSYDADFLDKHVFVVATGVLMPKRADCLEPKQSGDGS